LTIKLTESDEQILTMLAAHESIKSAAKTLRMSEGSIQVRLWRIRKKYKMALEFKTKIDTFRLRNPGIRKYLKTKE